MSQDFTDIDTFVKYQYWMDKKRKYQSTYFSKLLFSLLNMKLILTRHILSRCDTQLINNKGAFGAEPLIPLSLAFTALTPFSAAP